MDNSTLGTILVDGLNNPDCSFYVGAMLGQLMTARIIIFLVLGYFGIKYLDKLVIDPLIKLLGNLAKNINNNYSKKRSKDVTKRIINDYKIALKKLNKKEELTKKELFLINIKKKFDSLPKNG